MRSRTCKTPKFSTTTKRELQHSSINSSVAIRPSSFVFTSRDFAASYTRALLNFCLFLLPFAYCTSLACFFFFLAIFCYSFFFIFGSLPPFFALPICIYMYPPKVTYIYFPASGQAVATGVVPSLPRFLPSFLSRIGFINPTARRFFIGCLLTHALAFSESQFVRKKKSPRIYTSMHSGRFELTKLTYTRLEDNLI